MPCRSFRRYTATTRRPSCMVDSSCWRSLVEHHPGVSGTVLFPGIGFAGPGDGSGRWPGWECFAIGNPIWLLTCRDSFGAPFFPGFPARPASSGFLIHGKEPRCSMDRSSGSIPRHMPLRGCSACSGNLGFPQPAGPDFFLPAGRLPGGFDASSPYLVLHPYARGEGKSLTPAMIRAFARGTGGMRLVIVGAVIPSRISRPMSKSGATEPTFWNSPVFCGAHRSLRVPTAVRCISPRPFSPPERSRFISGAIR